MESNHINIAHINTRSITVSNESGVRIDHINEFLIKDLRCDVVACTETHLSDAVANDDIAIVNFSIERRDRNRHGGGVLFFIRNNINYVRLYDFESPNSEMLWIEIKNDSKVIILGVCYRPPGQNAEEIKSFLGDLEHALLAADQKRGATIILLGDFNDPCSKFDDSHELSQLKYELYNLSLAHGLSQLIMELTTEMNLLDLMFTNSKGSLSNVRVLDPIHDLDHFPIFATVEFKLRIECRNKFSRRVWHYENGNYENLALEIKNTPWHILFENCGSDTDEMVEVFTKIIDDITSENVPNYMVNIDPNDKQGMTNKVKKLFRTCHRLHKKYKKM